MKTLRLLALTLASCFFITAFAAPTVSGKTFLFVQSAKHAQFKPLTKHPGEYLLILKKVTRYVTYMSKKPVGNSGIIPIATFFQQWRQHHRQKNPAKIHLSTVHFDGVNVTTNKLGTDIFELHNPKYNAKNNTLEFTAIPIKTMEIMPTGNYKEISLFYDATNCKVPCPGCTPLC